MWFLLRTICKIYINISNTILTIFTTNEYEMSMERYTLKDYIREIRTLYPSEDLHTLVKENISNKNVYYI